MNRLIIVIYLIISINLFVTADTINSENVNIREYPFIGNNIITKLNKEQEVVITGMTLEKDLQASHFNYWYYISVKGIDGWVFGYFLDITNNYLELLPKHRIVTFNQLRYLKTRDLIIDSFFSGTIKLTKDELLKYKLATERFGEKNTPYEKIKYQTYIIDFGNFTVSELNGQYLIYEISIDKSIKNIIEIPQELNEFCKSYYVTDPKKVIIEINTGMFIEEESLYMQAQIINGLVERIIFGIYNH